ncbi:MAG: hypothetical protein QOH91_3740 [Mycobacterium sp.]|jgi:hypothetical protein|nr:hypothetical protein [Mycobacterium sp.]
MIKYGIGVQQRQVFTFVKVDEGSSNKRTVTTAPW